ncbi:MAG TPA: hypothetical protein PL009_10570 [Flavipsychrobacter sp.]|nr:hypothetical protein [Flavipsychrobacter sp.]
MKKQLLLIAGTVLTLASCQNEAADTGDNQAQIDSAVNARVEEMRTELMMQNDSLINAEAQRRADSIFLTMKDGNTAPAAPRKSTPARNTPAQTPSTPVKTTQDQKFEQRENGNKTISDDKKKEQDDKFKKRGG